MVGYPKYYMAGYSGKYRLNRTDQKHKDIKNYDNTSTIKQEIDLVEGDIVSQGVFEDAIGIESHGESITFNNTSETKESYLYPIEAKTPKIGWRRIFPRPGFFCLGKQHHRAEIHQPVQPRWR